MGIYVFGSNMFGQLGIHIEEKDESFTPLRLSFFDNKTVRKISAGTVHVLVLCDGNELYSWGLNDEKALGRISEKDEDYEVPNLVKCKYEIIDICAGSCYSAVVTKGGRVLVCGTFKAISGTFGILPKARNLEFLEEVEGLRLVKRINGGENHVMAVTRDGSLYTFGVNENLQLGRVCRERKKYRSLEPGSIVNSRQKGSYAIVGTSGGMAHSFAWDCEHRCYGWGCNAYGQLGNGMTKDSVFTRNAVMKNVKKVACGSNHSLILGIDGRVYGCGNNRDHQLGSSMENELRSLELIFENADDIYAGGSNSIIRVGNKLFSAGVNCYGECGYEDSDIQNFKEIPFDFGEIVDVQCGLNFTIVHTKS